MLNPPHYCVMEALTVWTTRKIPLKSSHEKTQERKLNPRLLFFFFSFFFAPLTARRQQPASRSRLMRGKRRTPEWTPLTEMAASKEEYANTADIAGPGGELVFMLSQMPSRST